MKRIKRIMIVIETTCSDSVGLAIAAAEHLADTFNDDGSLTAVWPICTDIDAKPRRPYGVGEYLESDADYLDNNRDLCVRLLNNLTMEP